MIRPYADYVLVDEPKLYDTTEPSLIRLPREPGRNDVMVARVLAVGPGRPMEDDVGRRMPVGVSVGDDVLFTRAAMVVAGEDPGSPNAAVLDTRTLVGAADILGVVEHELAPETLPSAEG